MYKPAMRILLKLFELIGCVACLITKQLTDQKSRRIAFRNQKFSREWSLLNNVTWSREGNAFANVTYGGYTLITGLLLISRCINPKTRPTLTDRIFLIIGVIFFFAIGSLVFASIEQIPPDLFDNAIILGSLSYFVGILYLIDLGDPTKRLISTQSQTDQPKNNQISTQTSSMPHSSEFKQLNISELENDVNAITAHTSTASNAVHEMASNGYYFSGDRVDTVHTKELPKSQQPIIMNVMNGEKCHIEQQSRSKFKKLSRKSDKNLEIDEYTTSYNFPHCSKSYVRNIPEGKNAIANYYKRHEFNITTSEDDNVDRPIGPGYVAQAARMWDRRAKRETYHEKSTIV